MRPRSGGPSRRIRRLLPPSSARSTTNTASPGTRRGYHADLADVEASYAAFFVAERDGEIVGTAGLTERGSLERLYVLPDARGSGPGRRS